MRKMCSPAVALTLVGVLATYAATVHAEEQAIEKLKTMRVSGTDPNLPLVPQTGKNADAIKENL